MGERTTVLRAVATAGDDVRTLESFVGTSDERSTFSLLLSDGALKNISICIGETVKKTKS